MSFISNYALCAKQFTCAMQIMKNMEKKSCHFGDECFRSLFSSITIPHHCEYVGLMSASSTLRSGPIYTLLPMSTSRDYGALKSERMNIVFFLLTTTHGSFGRLVFFTLNKLFELKPVGHIVM